MATTTVPEIHDAIMTLDPMDDAHWTKEGLPNLDVLSEKLGQRILRRECPDLMTRQYVTENAAHRDQELDAYESCIAAMDEARNALGAIPFGRRNPTLRRLLDEYQKERPEIMRHYERVKQRKKG